MTEADKSVQQSSKNKRKAELDSPVAQDKKKKKKGAHTNSPTLHPGTVKQRGGGEGPPPWTSHGFRLILLEANPATEIINMKWTLKTTKGSKTFSTRL